MKHGRPWFRRFVHRRRGRFRWMEQGIQACPFFWRKPVEDMRAKAFVEAMERGAQQPFQPLRSRWLDMAVPAVLIHRGFEHLGMSFMGQHRVTEPRYHLLGILDRGFTKAK